MVPPVIVIAVTICAVAICAVAVGGTVYYYKARAKSGEARPNAAVGTARPGVQNAMYERGGAKTDGFGFTGSAGAGDAGGYMEVGTTHTKR